MPTFCRHNRFLANCPICSRDQVQTVVPASGGSRAASRGQRARSARPASGRADGVRVRRIAREQEDGFASPFVPGLKASAAAERLAEEIAFASARLDRLAGDPPDLYREIAEEEDREEALWRAFLVAYVGPVPGSDPFASVRAVRTSWAGGESPQLEEVACGPRGARDPSRSAAALAAYRAWAERAGSQDAAYAGEASWSRERRFARVFERLALPGLTRDVRFDLLVTIGQLGLHELEAGSLQLGGPDETTVAAKRVFGIADTLLLERRASELAAASGVPLAALDLALWNWGRPLGAGTGPRERDTGGMPELAPDADAFTRVASALGL